MDQEQLNLIIRAAKVLQEKKEIYDYVIIVLPVLTAFIGWFASAWWQTRVFNKNTKKEHYYAAKEKAEAITALFSEFLEYVYSFYRTAKINANPPCLQTTDGDALCDFITQYQFKLGFIYQKLRITFPGGRFPIEKVTEQMKSFEQNIMKMNDIVVDLRKPEIDTDAMDSRIADLNSSNTAVITNITDEVSRIENSVIGILTNRGKELGIKEF